MALESGDSIRLQRIHLRRITATPVGTDDKAAGERHEHCFSDRRDFAKWRTLNYDARKRYKKMSKPGLFIQRLRLVAKGW